MNPLTWLEIIELALGIAKSATTGTKVAGDLATLTALEQIISKAIAAHNAESGQVLDLAKLTYEEPIQ